MGSPDVPRLVPQVETRVEAELGPRTGTGWEGPGTGDETPMLDVRLHIYVRFTSKSMVGSGDAFASFAWAVSGC